MAALIGDPVSDISRFHENLASHPSRQAQRQHQSPPQRQNSHPRTHIRDSPPRRSSTRPCVSAFASRSFKRRDNTSSHSISSASLRDPEETLRRAVAAGIAFTGDGKLGLPSPPPTLSPGTAAVGDSTVDHARAASMASQALDLIAAVHAAARQQKQQPSPPPSQNFQVPESSAASPFSPAEASPTPQTTQEPPIQSVIHIRDLGHVQSLLDANVLGKKNPMASGSAYRPRFEISGMPIADVIEMVSGLLTKITSTNDLQHDALQRNASHQQQASQSSDSSAHMSPLSQSVLAFHGKNVPAITILSYLSRIHKYCPTTYEVFLSLLVYFDRMTDRVNGLADRFDQARRLHWRQVNQSAASAPVQQDVPIPDDEDETDVSDSDLADEDFDEDDIEDDDELDEDDEDDGEDDDEDDEDDDEDDDDEMLDSPTVIAGSTQRGAVASADHVVTSAIPATYFVVDSFNIHRLVIAGVTCASKFFSDVFYTNSRYAKVYYLVTGIARWPFTDDGFHKLGWRITSWGAESLGNSIPGPERLSSCRSC